MPGYLYRSSSAYVNGTGALSPAMPSGWQIGDLLLYFTGCRSTSETLTTPSGWQLLSPDTNATNVKIFGRIAQNGDTAPSVDWSAANTGFASISAFYGDVYSDITTIVAHSGDRATSSTQLVGFPALTITTNECLVINGGRRFKTVTGDGETVSSSPSGITLLTENEPAGSANAAAFGMWQQTTATSLSLASFTFSIVDTSANTMGIALALKTAAIVVSTLYASQKNVFVNDTIIQF